jgi:lipoate-protein ligase A
MNDEWSTATWTVVDEVPLPPAVNVALDEVLLDEVAAGARGPTLRFWAWASRAVIIGRFQSLKNEVDQAAAQAMNVDVVRRISGGGAMFVEPERAVTYSLYFPESMVARLSIVASYAFCDSWVVETLRALGVPAFYQPINDIACADGKIGGAAQTRRGGAVLHHTTIAYEMNPTDMLRLLRIGREKLSDKGTTSAAKRVSPVARHTGKSRDEVYHALRDGFFQRFHCRSEGFAAEVLRRAEALATAKFADPAWTAALS